MATYIKQGQALEFENAPGWLEGYMRYRLTVLGDTPRTVMTYFIALREFVQWASVYKKTGRQPQTAAALREISIVSCPLATILGIKKIDVETYIYFLANNLGNSVQTRNKKLAALQGFYDYLIDEQAALNIRLDTNPVERIRRPKLPSKQPIYLPEEDRSSLLNSIQGPNAVRDYALLLLMLSTGIRVSEAVGIDMGDINMVAKTIRIRQGKGSKDRIAYLTDPCLAAIQDYLAGYRDAIPHLDTNALFVSQLRKQRLTVRAVQKLMFKHSQEAHLGGKGYTPHKLRHTTATMLAKDGHDLQVIQKVLGHEKPETTEIYTHLDHSDIATAVDMSSLAKLG